MANIYFLSILLYHIIRNCWSSISFSDFDNDNRPMYTTGLYRKDYDHKLCCCYDVYSRSLQRLSESDYLPRKLGIYFIYRVSSIGHVGRC